MAQQRRQHFVRLHQLDWNRYPSRRKHHEFSTKRLYLNKWNHLDLGRVRPHPLLQGQVCESFGKKKNEGLKWFNPRRENFTVLHAYFGWLKVSFGNQSPPYKHHFKNVWVTGRAAQLLAGACMTQATPGQVVNEDYLLGDPWRVLWKTNTVWQRFFDPFKALAENRAYQWYKKVRCRPRN